MEDVVDVRWYSVEYSKFEMPLLIVIETRHRPAFGGSSVEAYAFKADDAKEVSTLSFIKHADGDQREVLFALALQCFWEMACTLAKADPHPVGSIAIVPFDDMTKLVAWRTAQLYLSIYPTSRDCSSSEMMRLLRKNPPIDVFGPHD